jgi:hypothetical protein
MLEPKPVTPPEADITPQKPQEPASVFPLVKYGIDLPGVFLVLKPNDSCAHLTGLRQSHLNSLGLSLEEFKDKFKRDNNIRCLLFDL